MKKNIVALFCILIGAAVLTSCVMPPVTQYGPPPAFISAPNYGPPPAYVGGANNGPPPAFVGGVNNGPPPAAGSFAPSNGAPPAFMNRTAGPVSGPPAPISSQIHVINPVKTAVVAQPNKTPPKVLPSQTNKPIVVIKPATPVNKAPPTILNKNLKDKKKQSNPPPQKQ